MNDYFKLVRTKGRLVLALKRKGFFDFVPYDSGTDGKCCSNYVFLEQESGKHKIYRIDSKENKVIELTSEADDYEIREFYDDKGCEQKAIFFKIGFDVYLLVGEASEAIYLGLEIQEDLFCYEKNGLTYFSFLAEKLEQIVCVSFEKRLASWFCQKEDGTIVVFSLKEQGYGLKYVFQQTKYRRYNLADGKCCRMLHYNYELQAYEVWYEGVNLLPYTDLVLLPAVRGEMSLYENEGNKKKLLAKVPEAPVTFTGSEFSIDKNLWEMRNSEFQVGKHLWEMRNGEWLHFHKWNFFQRIIYKIQSWFA